MSQEIKNININDLVLWNENPRDPVGTESTDQDIANRAISKDGESSWSLKKLVKKMGTRFDQSEIPTVAYVNNKPVVYDGNRRVLIGKIIYGIVNIDDSSHDFSVFEFPESLPCNVCDQKTALEHVDRKHSESGSWKPLERDIFHHIHMHREKSPFLIFEEITNIISKNPELNQRFVKDEIFNPTTLLKLGFSASENKLKSKYEKASHAKDVLDEVIELVKEKKITTRNNRGKIVELVDQKLLSKQGSSFRDYTPEELNGEAKPRKTATSKRKEHKLFGKTLLLKYGSVNDLYSDLIKLYKKRNQGGYSENFHMIIRMGLRLLVEVSAYKDKSNVQKYCFNYFEDAKKQLTDDEKTTLSTQEVTKDKLVGLLHIGAHYYTATNNTEQTVAMSLIIGKMLEMSHGK